MRKPEVSVIVLTYNQEQTISWTLDSILMQQCSFPYEIVVSDDGSSDATRSVVMRYARAFPSVVRLLPRHERKGLVGNYFHALSHCRGALIADCAGDDCWCGLDSLQRKRDIMAEDPDAAVVHSDWVRLDVSGQQPVRMPSDSDGRHAPWRRDFPDGRCLLAPAIGSSDIPLIHLSTALYRKAIVEEALAADRRLVENESWGCEDLPVVAALLASGRGVRWIPDPTLVYTWGSSSISSPEKAADQARFYLAVSVMTEALARHYGVGRREIGEALASKLHYAVSRVIESGDRELLSAIRTFISDKKIRRPLGDRLKEYVKSGFRGLIN